MPRTGFAQRGRVARVGWLGWEGGAGTSASPLALESFKSGLTERGWSIGRDVQVVVRDGDRPASADLAAELMKAELDLLVAVGPMVFGAKTVARGTPLIFCINGDPVEAGLVASLPRPGGTLTGVTALSEDLAGKRLELLRETMRKGNRVAAIANETHPGVGIERDAIQAAAKRLGLAVTWYPLKSAADLDAAFARIRSDGTDAVLAVPDNLINRHAAQIGKFALDQRLPAISGWSEFVEAGNLMSYGPDPRGYFRQMGLMADRILRGARPQDIAVERPRDIELVVNLKVAKAIGLDLPPGLLLRADRQLV